MAILRHAAIPLQHAGGDGHVVEHAVAFAAIGKRVMGAAGQVGGDALVERRAAPRRWWRRPTGATARPSPATTGSRCAAGRRPQGAAWRRPPRRPGRARGADPPRPPAALRASRRRDDAIGDDPLAQPRGLRHREPVALRQRQDEVVRVERAACDDRAVDDTTSVFLDAMRMSSAA